MSSYSQVLEEFLPCPAVSRDPREIAVDVGAVMAMSPPKALAKEETDRAMRPWPRCSRQAKSGRSSKKCERFVGRSKSYIAT